MGKKKAHQRKRSKAAKAQTFRRKMEKEAAVYLQSVMIRKAAVSDLPGSADLEDDFLPPRCDSRMVPLLNQEISFQNKYNSVNSTDCPEIKIEEADSDLKSLVGVNNDWSPSSDTKEDPLSNQDIIQNESNFTDYPKIKTEEISLDYTSPGFDTKMEPLLKQDVSTQNEYNFINSTDYTEIKIEEATSDFLSLADVNHDCPPSSKINGDACLNQVLEGTSTN